MRLIIAAVGKFKPGPERELFERFMTRSTKLARQLGLSGPDHWEIDESRARSPAQRQQEEGQRLLAGLPAGGQRILLDERGKDLTSLALARQIGAWRDQGEANLAFLLGGPDGHGTAIKQACPFHLNLSSLTWPHLLARAMISEQIYRCVTILSGHPYHRE